MPPWLDLTLQVNGRIIKKRLHVRIEHVKPSRCREDFLKRKASNDKARHDAKVAGEKAPTLKRLPQGPRDGFALTGVTLSTITPIPYDVG